MTKNKTLYLPIGVIEIAQLLEDDKDDQIFYEVGDGNLLHADKAMFQLKELKESKFYIRTEDKPVIELGRDVNAV